MSYYFVVIYTDIEHYMCAKFHFVDLAGSERAHRTGNVGDRFKGNFIKFFLNFLYILQAGCSEILLFEAVSVEEKRRLHCSYCL